MLKNLKIILIKITWIELNINYITNKKNHQNKDFFKFS